jgi:circadian clock protein KaiC
VTELVPTGIRGLDEVLLGGLIRNNTTLVKGASGSGKTLLGLQFIHNGATQFDEPGVVVSFETNPDKLQQDVAGFGWDLKALQEARKLDLVFTSPEVLQSELNDPQSVLLQRAAEIGARRIFIDAVSILGAGGSDNHFQANGNGSYRTTLNLMINNLHRSGLTAIISHELALQGEGAASLETADVIADAVICLERGQRDRGIYRSISIEKSRAQNVDSGRHTMRITPGVGIEVFRRVQAEIRGLPAQQTSAVQRSVVGVPAVDTLFGGGVYDASVTLVIGVSGIGKSVLGYQIAAESGRLGRKALLVSLDEHPMQMQRNAEAIGIDLRGQVEAGSVSHLYDSPLELEIDAHFHEMKRTIEERNVERLVVDGLTTYQNAIADPRIFREFIHGLMAFAKRRMMTLFVLYENPEIFGISRYMPDAAISSIVDNILLLNFVEVGNEARRCLTVIKARGCAHDLVSREYRIGHGGISLMQPDGEGKSFDQLDSLISRAPIRRRHTSQE